MNPEIFAALARHILTASAGALLLKYGFDGTTVDAIVGGFAALAGVGWSIWEKKREK